MVVVMEGVPPVVVTLPRTPLIATVTAQVGVVRIRLTVTTMTRLRMALALVLVLALALALVLAPMLVAALVVVRTNQPHRTPQAQIPWKICAFHVELGGVVRFDAEIRLFRAGTKMLSKRCACSWGMFEVQALFTARLVSMTVLLAR